MKIANYSIKGTKLADLTLPREFTVEKNLNLLAQSIRVYEERAHIGLADTKTRAEVNRTKKKWYKQKGTGGARHGARSAPIFVGGAKAHGPSGRQNYSLKLSKKQKQASLVSALSQQFKEGNILAVAGLDKLEPKTKKFDQVMDKLKPGKKKILLVLAKEELKIKRGVRNLNYLDAAINLTTYTVLNAKTIIFTKESLKCFA